MDYQLRQHLISKLCCKNALFVSIMHRQKLSFFSENCLKPDELWGKLRVSSRLSHRQTTMVLKRVFPVMKLLEPSIIIIFISLTYEGSHREVYEDFQPSDYIFIFLRWGQELFRPQVLCTSKLTLPNC